MGLMRNLSAAQIVEQLVEARRLLQETPDAGAATNIVFMGMGMPSSPQPYSCISVSMINVAVQICCSEDSSLCLFMKSMNPEVYICS